MFAQEDFATETRRPQGLWGHIELSREYKTYLAVKFEVLRDFRDLHASVVKTGLLHFLHV